MPQMFCVEFLAGYRAGSVVDEAERPDLLFNPSNDAWFGAWGPPQHLAQAQLRAVEEGLPVVRATPNGISALIDPTGKIISAVPRHQVGVIDARLPQALKPTVFKTRAVGQRAFRRWPGRRRRCNKPGEAQALRVKNSMS